MIRVRHPSHNYIKYMAVYLPVRDVELINDNLMSLGLSTIDSEYLGNVSEEIADIPPNFKYNNKGHEVSANWLRSHLIGGMAFNDATVNSVRALILLDTQVRDFTERSLLAGHTHSAVSAHLTKLGYSVPSAVIASFSHYYWDVRSMQRGSWDVYFRSDSSKRTTTKYLEYSSAMLGGSDAILVQAGIMAKKSSQEKLRIVEDILMDKFMVVSTLPMSEDTINMQTALAASIVRVARTRTTDNTKLDKALSKLEQFKVIREKNSIKKLKDLAKEGTSSLRTPIGDKNE